MNLTKSIKIIAALCIIVTTLNSCTRKAGDWDDIIELSQKEVNFNSTADAITITTEGDWWWISDISLNDEYINFEYVETTEPNFEIVETEFEISRKSETELEIKMTENPTMEQRELLIGLQAGNYFDAIKVIQKGKL